jgi:hypothetical protein
MARSWIGSAVIVALGFCTEAHGQTQIAQFGDVAGKWVGHTSPKRYSVTLEIDPSGRFKARWPLGAESGAARLEGGAIVLPLVEHQGSLELVLVGETLTGPGVIGGRSGTVNLTRADRMVSKEE